MTGPRSSLKGIIQTLVNYFGEGMDGEKGGFFQSHSFVIGTLVVYYQQVIRPDRSQYVIAEIPGGMLAELSPGQIQSLAYELLGHGCKSTRCDIAIDLYDRPELIEEAHQSWRDGHLVGAKKILHLVEETSGGVVTGKTLNVGVRGKDGSGRYLRIYDKGLQTKTMDEGKWNRWEAELTDDIAAEFILQFAEASDMNQVMLKHAFGVVDFLEEPDIRRSRRQRCAWFQSLLARIEPITLKKRRSASTLYSKMRWYQTCVMPTLQTISDVTSKSLDQVMLSICGPSDHQIREKELHKPFIREVCSAMGIRPHEIVGTYYDNRRILQTA